MWSKDSFMVGGASPRHGQAQGMVDDFVGWAGTQEQSKASGRRAGAFIVSLGCRSDVARMVSQAHVSVVSTMGAMRQSCAFSRPSFSGRAARSRITTINGVGLMLIPPRAALRRKWPLCNQRVPKT